MGSEALMTDMYELTMLDAWIKDGRQDDPAVFEVFARRLTPGHRYGVVAGIERVVEAIENFRFDSNVSATDFLDIKWLRENLNLSEETLEFLREYRFTGDLIAYREGELYFPGSPIITVKGRLADVLLETVILSILNHDCAIASKAARIVAEAHGAPLIEMGSRRTHEDAAVAAARAAYLVGFGATSNLLAGSRYGIPVKGTAAHAFTLSYKARMLPCVGSGEPWACDVCGAPGESDCIKEPHTPTFSDEDAELNAFTAQVEAMGHGTTLLVDTFDIARGVNNAVKAAGTKLGAIRIDSGDLAANAEMARKLLDGLGAYATRIIVTSDLDEHVIKDLRIAGAPIDGYGVGTKLVSAEPAGMVYKLVDVNYVGVAKAAKDKRSVGGRKLAYRTYDADNHKMTGERVLILPEDAQGQADQVMKMPVHSRVLQVEAMKDGKRSEVMTLEEAREWHHSVVGELPLNERAVWHGDHGPFLTAEVTP